MFHNFLSSEVVGTTSCMMNSQQKKSFPPKYVIFLF